MCDKTAVSQERMRLFLPLVSSSWLLSLFFPFSTFGLSFTLLMPRFFAFPLISFFDFLFSHPLYTLSGLLTLPLPSLLGRSQISSARRSRLITLFSCISFFFFRVLLFSLHSSHLSKTIHREYQILRDTAGSRTEMDFHCPQLAFLYASSPIATMGQWGVPSVYCLDLTTTL